MRDFYTPYLAPHKPYRQAISNYFPNPQVVHMWAVAIHRCPLFVHRVVGRSVDESSRSGNRLVLSAEGLICISITSRPARPDRTVNTATYPDQRSDTALLPHMSRPIEGWAGSERDGRCPDPVIPRLSSTAAIVGARQ